MMFSVEVEVDEGEENTKRIGEVLMNREVIMTGCDVSKEYLGKLITLVPNHFLKLHLTSTNDFILQ